MPVLFGGPGILPGLGALPGATQKLSLAPGQAWMIPNGWFQVHLGWYTIIQCWDQVVQTWMGIGSNGYSASSHRVRSDGFNYRVINPTGCAVGATITAVGSGYTSAPTVTASAGGSIWRAVVGGSVATAGTIVNGGTGYVYAPQVTLSAPPAGGVAATARCTIANGVVNSLTVDNQGAGYPSPPTVTFINDPREGQNGLGVGQGATATVSLTGAGTVCAIICVDYGTPIGNSTVPTLNITGGGGSGATATALMCWSVQGYTVTTAGAGYPTTGVVVSGFAVPVATGPRTNPWTQERLVRKRPAIISANTAGGAFSATGQVISDGGIYDQVPLTLIWNNMFPAPSTAVVFGSPTMGGITDTFRVYPG